MYIFLSTFFSNFASELQDISEVLRSMGVETEAPEARKSLAAMPSGWLPMAALVVKRGG